METAMMIGFALFFVGVVAGFILDIGTTKYERMYVDRLNLDPKLKKRIKIGFWVKLGAVLCPVVAIVIGNLLGLS